MQANSSSTSEHMWKRTGTRKNDSYIQPNRAKRCVGHPIPFARTTPWPHNTPGLLAWTTFVTSFVRFFLVEYCHCQSCFPQPAGGFPCSRITSNKSSSSNKNSSSTCCQSSQANPISSDALLFLSRVQARLNSPIVQCSSEKARGRCS